MAYTTPSPLLLWWWNLCHAVWMLHAWRAWKRILRLVTGTHEIERICTAGHPSPQMAHALEQSLLNSANMEDVKESIRTDNFEQGQLALRICAHKGLHPELPHIRDVVVPNMTRCLAMVHDANVVVKQVFDGTQQKFDHNSPTHEALLEDLWQGLQRDVVRRGGRYTKEWGELGFQGTDPATDLRGMGMWGLEDLHYLVTRRTAEAQRIYSASLDVRTGFPFAITGINVSSLTYQLLHARTLNRYLYTRGCEQATVHHLYAVLFARFAQYYGPQNPADIMAFGPIFKTFSAQVRTLALAGALEQQDDDHHVGGGAVLPRTHMHAQ